MNKLRKIAIFVPKGLRTGGPEAIHQLHHQLLERKINSVLIPYPGTSSKKDVDEYSKYKPIWSKVSQLNKRDIVIVPCDLDYLPFWHFFFISKKYLFSWMLAVDFCADSDFRRYESKNFPLPSEWQMRISEKKFFKSLKNKIFSLIDIYIKKREKPYKKIGRRKITFLSENYLFQSIYAKNVFNKTRNSKCSLMLSDYVNIEFSKNLNVNKCGCLKWHVSYFPSKSQHLMEFLLKINSDNNDLIHFIPMKNIPKNEVLNILAYADLYLDLGFFPGKDRLPRESVLLNTPVLLAKRGSARYFEDFPLVKDYLVNLSILSQKQVYNLIVDTLKKGKAYNITNQAQFKETVLKEKQVFAEEITRFLHETKFPH